MSLRTTVRAVFGVLFVLLALPVVIVLANESAAVAPSPASLVGVVVAEHGDDFAADTERPYLTLVTAHDRYGLVGPGAAWVKPGQYVHVQGNLAGGTISLASQDAVQLDTASKLSAAESAALQSTSVSSATAQAKKLAVLLINFVAPTPAPTPSLTPCTTPTASPSGTTASASPTATPTPTATPSSCPTPPPATPTPTPTATPYQPWTTTQVAGYYFNNTKSVASFYREVSNGTLTLTGNVFGWYTLAMSTSTCDYNGFATAARAAATAAGVDLTAYTNIAYAFPRVSACSWGGLGNVNGPYSWINGNAAMGVYVPTHELGHNFGSHHASSLTCVNSSGVRVQYSSNCTASEYGDPFDVMGSNASSSGGIHHLNTWARRQIGVLTTADQMTVTASGTYSVATAQVGGGTPRILRVLRPSGNYYYLEFRQPYGLFENWATTSAAVTGVMIRIAPDTSRIQSKLIDAHPETAGFGDAPLGVGEKFVDKVNDITIITRSISAAGATVYVQVGPDITAPTAPGSLSASWTGASSVGLAWTAATDEIGVSGYQVRRDGTLLATVSGTTLSFDDTAAPASTQRYTVAARDAAGNVGPAVSAYVGAPDTTAPLAPASLGVVADGPGQATLSWPAASDNVGVTDYEVRRDGTLLATVDALTYATTGLTSLQSYTFTVTASDAAGNVGPAAQASLLMPDLVEPGTAGTLNVTSTAKTTVSLGWSPATDDVGVVGYQISRDGTAVGTTASTSFDDVALAPATTYAYAVAAVDAAGNLGVPATVSATTIEATPPTVSAPVAAFPATGQLGTTSVPVVVSWAATDTSGVALVELQQSKNGGSWTALTLSGAAATSASLTRTPGNTYRFRARATDSVGNRSSWVAGPTMSLIARQEGSSTIAYGGSWTSATASSAYGGALKYATRSTATATLTFTGRSVAWIAKRSTTRGVADVYVDGVLAATIDLYSASSQPRMIVFTRSWGSSAAHTLQVRVKATSLRPRVDVDAFLVIK
jgi:chitodextrinase